MTIDAELSFFANSRIVFSVLIEFVYEIVIYRMLIFV